MLGWLLRIFKERELVATDVKAKVADTQKGLDFTKTTYAVELATNKGPIRLQLFPDLAPGHVKNFVALAKIGYYDGVIFHRVISDFMIQGGCPQGTGTGGPGYTINAEFNDTPHVAGVLSMARTNDPNSAGSQFFICTGRHTHLDRNYTAFGKVADEESMNTVKAIAAVKVGANDRPKEDVKISKATVTEAAK
jgi:peptidyl-prolyl cis-trans isomerase B (cyclophilin B)